MNGNSVPLLSFALFLCATCRLCIGNWGWLITPRYSQDGDVSTADTVADGGPDEDQEADEEFKP